VVACGICGTDTGFVRSAIIPRLTGVPQPLGHEFSGVVVEVGSDADAPAVGTRVAVNPMGSAMIGTGGSGGGLSDLVAVPAGEGLLVPIEESVSHEAAALIEPLSVGAHAVARSGAAPGAKVAIHGAGPIGLGALLELGRLGVGGVVVTDLSVERLSLASRLGATVIEVGGSGLGRQLAEAHGEVATFMGPRPATDIHIDATGSPQVIDKIIAVARPGAVCTTVSVHTEPVPVDFQGALMCELDLRWSMGYPEEFPGVAQLVAAPDFDAEAFISHRFALDEVAAAFATAADPSHGAKVIIRLR